MHLAIYGVRSDIQAIVHAHPITATGFALAGIPLNQNLLPEIVLTLGSIPLARYGTPSTCELSEAVAEEIATHDGLLMANHGALTVGKNLEEAYYRMEIVEHYAKTVLVAYQLGEPKELTRANATKLRTLKDAPSQLNQLLQCKSE